MLQEIKVRSICVTSWLQYGIYLEECTIWSSEGIYQSKLILRRCMMGFQRVKFLMCFQWSCVPIAHFQAHGTKETQHGKLTSRTVRQLCRPLPRSCKLCFSASALSIRNRSTYFAPSFTRPLTSSTFSFISWSSSSRACIFSSCASAWAVAAAMVSRGWGWICRNRLSWSLASRICWARVAASLVRAFALT